MRKCKKSVVVFIGSVSIVVSSRLLRRLPSGRMYPDESKARDDCCG